MLYAPGSMNSYILPETTGTHCTQTAQTVGHVTPLQLVSH